MPLVTGPPILIDPVNFSRQSAAEINPMGPFQNGSNLYLALADSVTEGNSGVFKSTDGGNTWTPKDQAHAPVFFSKTFWADYASGTGIIYILGPDPTRTFEVLTPFNTNTDLFGAPISGIWVDPNSGGDVLYHKSNGDHVSIFIDSSTGLQYQLTTGGTMNNPVVLDGSIAGTNAIMGGCVDPADRGHFVYVQGPNIHYNQISSAFALGTPTSFGAVDRNVRATVQIWNSNIVLAWTDLNVVKVAIGTPLGAPVFTTQSVSTSGGAAQITYATLAIDKNGDLVVFWVVTDYSGSPIVDRQWMSTFDGVSTWGAPVLFYDEVANPPANSRPQGFQFIHTGQALQLANSSWVFPTALETTDGVNNFCTGFVLLTPPITPPPTQTLQMLKTVQGGPASPSDFTLIATGGSPEVVISGPGPSVGPDNVSPGTFELSEIAPGGAQWDASTSTWDGATVWDGGDYTPVWNCGGATMPTPTSVVVGAGGGSPVVNPTQVPVSDPTFRSLLSGGRFEFVSSGGGLYQVGWTSNNKLAMFKRVASMAGASWAEMDAFGSPEQGNQSGYGKATINAAGTIITVAFLGIGRNSLASCGFDTTIDAWLPRSNDLAIAGTPTLFGFVQQSSGKLIAVMGNIGAMFVYANSGPGWHAVIGIALGTFQVFDACVDSADAIHVVFTGTPGTSTGYIRLDPVTFAAGPTTVILGATSLTLGGYPTIIPWGASSIAIAGIDQTGAAAFKAQAFIGTPLAAAAFTTYVIGAPLGGEVFSFPKMAVAQDATLHYFYVDDAGAGAITVKESDFNGSTWSAPVVFYDALSHPPNSNVPAADQEISALDPVNIEVGSPLVAHWAIGSAMETLQPTEVTTAEVIEASGSSSAVVCTVTNIFTGPSPGPPGPSESNPVGCFELLRVDVTLTPARHLPVRGSVK